MIFLKPPRWNTYVLTYKIYKGTVFYNLHNDERMKENLNRDAHCVQRL